MPSCGISQLAIVASVPIVANSGGSLPAAATSSPRVMRQTPKGRDSFRHSFVISM
jgi:hypothetical protein